MTPDKMTDAIAKSRALDLLVNNADFGEPRLFEAIQPESHIAMLQVHMVEASHRHLGTGRLKCVPEGSTASLNSA